MSRSHLPHLAQRLFNVPIAILPGKAEIVMAALGERFGVVNIINAPGLAAPKVQTGTDGWGDPIYETPYDNVGPVAVIAVEGTLVQRNGDAIRPESGMTGYAGIRLAFLAALDDPDVQAIVLSIDSPGGEVAGCFDLVDLIYGARGRKPIVAILNEHACSAAYAIASAADRIVVPRTGIVGSIGVIFLHVDMSQALSRAGLAVTFITYGDRKGDGWPEIPLSKDAKADIQHRIDTTGELFVATVARNRGLSEAAVRATQAAVYMGAEGVSIGLADAVMAPSEAFTELLAQLS